MFTIGSLLAVLGSSSIGSIIGIIGGILNRKADIEAKRLDLEHEAKRWSHEANLRDKDIEYAKTEAAGRRDVAFEEAEGVIESARFKALADAQTADAIEASDIKKAGKWAWAVALAFLLNKVIRPVLTIVLCFVALKVNWLVLDFFTAGWEGFTLAQKYDAGMQALAWVMGQASAVIGYWFMSRGTKR